MRNVRRDGMDGLKKAEKDHVMSQDDHKRSADELQKLTDKYIADIEAALAVKEKEVMHV